jgi:anti-sigma B factor antagonist
MTDEEITVPNRENVAIVNPTGELDLAGAPAFREAIERALATDPIALEIDLAEVTFLDSSALSVIVGAGRESTDRGIAFRLTNPVRNVRRVLEITDLDRLVDDR